MQFVARRVASEPGICGLRDGFALRRHVESRYRWPLRSAGKSRPQCSHCTEPPTRRDSLPLAGTKVAGFHLADERRIADDTATTGTLSNGPRFESDQPDPQALFRDVGRVCLFAEVHRQAHVPSMCNLLAHGP